MTIVRQTCCLNVNSFIPVQRMYEFNHDTAKMYIVHRGRVVLKLGILHYSYKSSSVSAHVRTSSGFFSCKDLGVATIRNYLYYLHSMTSYYYTLEVNTQVYCHCPNTCIRVTSVSTLNAYKICNWQLFFLVMGD